MKVITYPDGGKYIVNDKNETSLVYRINSYEDLFLLKSIKDANPALEEITIPCMFQQQHDRRFEKNQSFELKLVCDFINSCGFKKVNVFHPHSDVLPALLNNCEVIDNEKFIRQVLEVLIEIHHNPNFSKKEANEPVLKNLILMSSDAGGFKPLMKLCDKIGWQGETESASKARDKEKLTQVVGRQDFGGKDILIVDDIIVGGNTFIGLAKILRERNVGKLYLACSHFTVEKPNPDLFTLYDRVFTTNSKGLDYNIPTPLGVFPGFKTPENLTVINLF